MGKRVRCKKVSAIKKGDIMKQPKKQRQVKTKEQGRPKLNHEDDDFKFEVDPTEGLKEITLNYLGQIGLCHGLVFSEQHRKALQKQDMRRPQELRINWADSHNSWSQDQEKQKAMASIASIDLDLDTKELSHILVSAGEIICSEASKEFYQLLVSAIRYSESSGQEQIIDQCWQQGRFLTKKFIHKQICYFTTKVDKHKIKLLFYTFFKAVAAKMQQILRQT